MIDLTRGDDETLNLSVLQSPAPGAAAQDITGWTIWLTAKRSLTDTDPGVFQRSTSAGGITITNGTAGLATITIIPANTTPVDNLLPGTILEFDIQGKDGSNKIKTLSRGQFRIVGEITLAT
jgi:hypothetical protein